MTNKKVYIAKIFRAEKNSFENKLIATKQSFTKKRAIILARTEVIKYGEEDWKKECKLWLNDLSYNLNTIDYKNKILLDNFINDKENHKNQLETENFYYTIKLFSKKVNKIYIAKIFGAENLSYQNDFDTAEAQMFGAIDLMLEDYEEDKLLTTKEAYTKEVAINLARQTVICYAENKPYIRRIKRCRALRAEDLKFIYFKKYDEDPVALYYEDLLNDFINNKEIRKNELKTENYYYTIKLFSKKVK